MKKLIAFVLTIVCVLGLVGCSNTSSNDTTSATETTIPTNTTQEQTEDLSVPSYTTIKLSYHGNKENSILIEDKSICSKLMDFVLKADGEKGESTKGYYGVPYTITICFEGEKEPLIFSVWSSEQYSTSKHIDSEGYAYFFNDDISDLYKYLEENYPDEFWYSTTADGVQDE